MHEMSIASSLLAILQGEMAQHQLTRLHSVTVCCGALTSVVPTSLELAFSIVTSGTSLSETKLTIVPIPIRLACGRCCQNFSPERQCPPLFAVCPECGEDQGHNLLAGAQLFIDTFEAS